MDLEYIFTYIRINKCYFLFLILQLILTIALLIYVFFLSFSPKIIKQKSLGHNGSNWKVIKKQQF